MSCDTTHTLKFKHRKAEKLDGGLEYQQPSDFLNEIYNPEHDEEEED